MENNRRFDATTDTEVDTSKVYIRDDLGLEWREIEGYPFNEVSNTGIIRWTYTGEIVRQRLDHQGNSTATLYWYGEPRTVMVRRVVAKAFIEQPPGMNQVININRDRQDNAVENLRWTNQRNNPYRRSRNKVHFGLIIHVDELNKDYHSIQECADALGAKYQNVYAFVRGRVKTVKGYHLQLRTKDGINLH